MRINYPHIILGCKPGVTRIAQLDRASASKAEGCRFEPCYESEILPYPIY